MATVNHTDAAHGHRDDVSAGRFGHVLDRLRALPPFRVDLAIGLVLLTAGLIEMIVRINDLSSAELGWVTVGMIGTTVPLAWRRSHPNRVMTIVGVSGGSASIAMGDLSFFAAFGILVALYSVTAHGRWRDAVGAGLVTAVVLALLALQMIPEFGVISAISNFMIFGTAWVLGYAMRTRARLTEELAARAEAAERTRAEEARRAVEDERVRIARELHDVVAHTVSVMVVQAGAARRIGETDPGAVGPAVARIEQTGREAMTELRRLLAVLRDDSAGYAEPQPDLGRLDDLADKMRDAGLPVNLQRAGDLTQLPPGVDLSAYRIVQEALTNVLKHAGPTRRVDVRLERADRELSITVVDDGQGAAAGDGQGRGLIGLRERAALHGGDVVARPRRGGGFEVRARLPIDPARPRATTVERA